MPHLTPQVFDRAWGIPPGYSFELKLKQGSEVTLLRAQVSDSRALAPSTLWDVSECPAQL